jgi:hypothetical protein
MDDPEDVYSVWLPPHGRASVTVRGDANVDIALWSSRTKTVFERGRALRRDLLDYSERPGTRADVVTARSTSARGAYVYADVFLAPRVARAAYTLTATARR